MKKLTALHYVVAVLSAVGTALHATEAQFPAGAQPYVHAASGVCMMLATMLAAGAPSVTGGAS